ncbi:MAG: VOC family protein [Acidobacteria bacterium]|nr:VOC family protein [Acidobacteriota bacterium]
MTLDGIAQIAIPVEDMPRAIEFYRDRLGLKFLFQAGEKLAFFECGGIRLMLDIPADARFQHPSSIVYFSVRDIRAAHEQLSARGVRFEEAPHVIARMGNREVWLAAFDDTEGNVMALMSEVNT